jgi:hypothetical protein
MQFEVVGPDDGVPVLYFHGAASARDIGPSDGLCSQAGIRLFRFCRPGYDDAPADSKASLADVAEQALSSMAEQGNTDVTVLGWSGGGPYALASAFGPAGIVAKIGLVASWAPMQPPHPKLPGGVRFFMKAAQVLPRPLLRLALGATGRRTTGHVDDIRRIGRSWGFALEDLPPGIPIRAWHSADDNNVPIDPWRLQNRIALQESAGNWHEPTEATWLEILNWAKDGD